MTDIEQRVLALFHELFQDRSIELNADFYDLGGDSNMAVTFGLMLEDEFRIEIPLDLLEEVTSAAGLAVWIEDIKGGQRAA
ncbi:acyl carrier protein [Sphingomonas sp. R647]|uniref:acyl carrier protein n=1 Tax=Sphingomonas sp. R647 TaxID=2875233 RepID=UPI001CD4B87B|nr:acyl carrier protein [Sphingomonas sp. R647]MCA1196449.1 acyl carrier protein [Sphingomonas sp. R647]